MRPQIASISASEYFDGLPFTLIVFLDLFTAGFFFVIISTTE